MKLKFFSLKHKLVYQKLEDIQNNTKKLTLDGMDEEFMKTFTSERMIGNADGGGENLPGNGTGDPYAYKSSGSFIGQVDFSSAIGNISEQMTQIIDFPQRVEQMA